MATVNVTITIQAPPLPAALMRGIQPDAIQDLFPNTVRRLGELGREGQRLWMEKAMQIPGTDGRPLRLGTGPGDRMVFLNSSQYAQSITVEPVVSEGGDLTAVVGTADRQAMTIEVGGPEIDLHAVLQYSQKARMSKAGHKYLLVPFRHAATAPGGPGGSRFQTASNVIPPRVLGIMRQKTSSLVARAKRSEPSVNYPGKLAKRNLYKRRGGSLTADDMAQAGSTDRNLLGMKRIGGKGHHGYITIRTLTQANPDGWRIRGYEAQHLASRTAEELQRMAETYFEDALKADAAGWVSEALAS